MAIKVIRPDLLGSAEAAARFKREARAAAGFAHPNVVTVHDFSVAEDGRAYLVMELLSGCSLREALRRDGRFPTPRARAVLGGVCAAVEAAHERRLLHRDLKPENVFLVRAGDGETPKVLDFGVAKALDAGEGTASQVDTGTGQLVGTLAYMSPEQLQGGAPEPAWDVWALTVIAYEMLTGAAPLLGHRPPRPRRRPRRRLHPSLAAPRRRRPPLGRALRAGPRPRPAPPPRHRPRAPRPLRGGRRPLSSTVQGSTRSNFAASFGSPVPLLNESLPGSPARSMDFWLAARALRPSDAGVGSRLDRVPIAPYTHWQSTLKTAKGVVGAARWPPRGSTGTDH